MRNDLAAAVKAGTDIVEAKTFKPSEVNRKLSVLRKQYKLKILKVNEKSTGPLTVERKVHGEVNPSLTGPAVAVQLPEIWEGTRANPFDINWPKPATNNYPTIYLGGVRKDKAQRQKIYSNSYLASLVGQPDPDVPGSVVKAYIPHRRNTLPGGDVIGVTQNNQVLVGKSLKFDAALSSTTGGGDKLNKILRKHGLDVQGSDFNADHVLERQLGGPDAVENLWPLNSSINGSGGSIISKLSITISNGKSVHISDLKNISRKYFLKVASTL